METKPHARTRKMPATDKLFTGLAIGETPDFLLMMRSLSEIAENLTGSPEKSALCENPGPGCPTCG